MAAVKHGCKHQTKLKSVYYLNPSLEPLGYFEEEIYGSPQSY